MEILRSPRNQSHAAGPNTETTISLHLRSVGPWPVAALLGLLVWPVVGWAKELSLALVTLEDGRPVAVESRQSLWKSPYGGWIVAAGPLGISVDV